MQFKKIPAPRKRKLKFDRAVGRLTEKIMDEEGLPRANANRKARKILKNSPKKGAGSDSREPRQRPSGA